MTCPGENQQTVEAAQDNICPECRQGRHVCCLDDGSSTWTDRCKCECGDYPPLRLVNGAAIARRDGAR